MTTARHDEYRRSALRFVVLIGVVSLFADMTYEGARGISGPFLATLGASGTVVGVVAGLGELIGYGLRLGSGFLSDRTRRYWAITLWGYAINMLAVPLLALAGSWQIAAALGQINQPSCVPILIQLLGDEDVFVRSSAAFAITDMTIPGMQIPHWSAS